MLSGSLSRGVFALSASSLRSWSGQGWVISDQSGLRPLRLLAGNSETDRTPRTTAGTGWSPTWVSEDAPAAGDPSQGAKESRTAQPGREGDFD